MWNHISQPLTSGGSAVNIVIREFTKVASAAGVSSTVAAAPDKDLGMPHAQLLPVNFSGIANHGQLELAERLADAASGWMGFSRKHTARIYQPIADALVRSNGPIIVHDGYLGAAGLVTLRRMFPDRPISLWMHQPLSPAYSPREVRRFLSLADSVICVSDWIKDSLCRAARTESMNGLATVLNGVDSERFTPAHRPDTDDVPSVLFVGRVVKIKGPDILASALNDLHREGIDFRATFVGTRHPDVAGESRFEHALRRQTAPFSRKVSFVPFRPNSELPDLYRSHQIMVVPSRFEEPCSLALLEGMASGLAMVASRRGGTPEIGEDSLHYFSHANELTGKLRPLLQDAELRSRWGAMARSRAEQLSWSRTFERARDLISPGAT